MQFLAGNVLGLKRDVGFTPRSRDDNCRADAAEF